MPPRPDQVDSLRFIPDEQQSMTIQPMPLHVSSKYPSAPVGGFPSHGELSKVVVSLDLPMCRCMHDNCSLTGCAYRTLRGRYYSICCNTSPPITIPRQQNQGWLSRRPLPAMVCRPCHPEASNSGAARTLLHLRMHPCQGPRVRAVTNHGPALVYHSWSRAPAQL